MVERLLSFIEKSPTAFHAASEIASLLHASGFSELCEGEGWSLRAGGRYFVRRNQASLIAFTVTDPDFNGFMLMASHLDSPTFKLKPSHEVTGDYVRLSTERYGGMNPASFLDRPLSLAGRVLVRRTGGVESRLFDFAEPICLIPSVAGHLLRGSEKGELNPAIDLLPLYGMRGEAGELLSAVAERLSVDADDILSHDIYLYNAEGGCRFGKNREFIASPRLDDLLCAYPILCGFLEAEASDAIPVAAFFDSEEVGSLTRQGAESSFLSDTLLRINEALSGDMNDYRCRLANSFLLSADNAHALHPNRPECSDRENAPRLNGGVVLKTNACMRYTTDAVSGGLFTELCRRSDIPIQHYANREGILGGATLGHLALRQTSILAADIGLAQLAMHAAYESAGALDAVYLARAATVFFESSLHILKDGKYELQ